jgi:hypothetical protein
MILSENLYPPRITSGAGFFGIMLYETAAFRCGSQGRAETSHDAAKAAIRDITLGSASNGA